MFFHAFFIKRDVSIFEKCLCCEEVCIWKTPASENREMFVLERGLHYRNFSIREMSIWDIPVLENRGISLLEREMSVLERCLL